MKHVPQHHLTAGDIVPVTAARQFVAKHQIKAPALILVKRTEHTTDRFYWSAKGMYGALYAEHNYFNFSCLRNLHSELYEKGILKTEFGTAFLSVEAELEDYRYEFAFI